MDTRTIGGALGRPARGFLVALVGAALLAVGTLPAVSADDAFPVTVVDSEGTEVTVEAIPERIISLAPSTTETIFALGAGDRLVGATDFDDYPAEAVDLADVATYTGVIMEQVVALEPDLVFAAGNFFTPPDDIARMRGLGYRVIVLYAPDVDTVMSDIELIGTAVGAPEEARSMTAQMRAQMEAIEAEASAAGTTPTVFYELGAEPEIYAPAPDSFLADMIVRAGGEPITTGDAALWSIPLEALVVADPEVIVLGDANYGTCPDDVAARAGWEGMTAVVNGDVRPVDDVPITRPGPRLAQGLASLARAIHPTLELTDFPPDPPICEAA
ncbi:MAG: helical backbone metal receptor [Candidatus Limnocylindrales bacterium]